MNKLNAPAVREDHSGEIVPPPARLYSELVALYGNEHRRRQHAVMADEGPAGTGSQEAVIQHGVGTSQRPSRPGEFHPQPLTEPDVNLSTYPARATHRRLPPSAATSGFLLGAPVDPNRPRRE